MTDAVVKVYDKVWIASEVRRLLKAEYPECKFSVVVHHYSEIQVSLMAAPESPYTDGKGPAYEQLNHYYLDKYQNVDLPCYPGEMVRDWSLTEKAVAMFKKVTEIANAWNWDHSDLQSDYYDVNYYFQLNIGKWDKAFEVKK